MFPMFWVLVVISVVVLWCGICTLFKPLGGWIKEWIDDIKEAFKEDNDNE